MTGLSYEAMRELAAELKEELAPRASSKPRADWGAPNLGTGWQEADSRPAAWKAFGEDAS